MTSDPRSAASDPPPTPPATGWASVFFAGLALVVLPSPDQMGFRYEARAILSVFAGAVAAVGVGFAIRAMRKRTPPVWVAIVGLMGNAGMIAVVVARLLWFWTLDGDDP